MTEPTTYGDEFISLCAEPEGRKEVLAEAQRTRNIYRVICLAASAGVAIGAYKYPSTHLPSVSLLLLVFALDIRSRAEERILRVKLLDRVTSPEVRSRGRAEATGG